MQDVETLAALLKLGLKELEPDQRIRIVAEIMNDYCLYCGEKVNEDAYCSECGGYKEGQE